MNVKLTGPARLEERGTSAKQCRSPWFEVFLSTLTLCAAAIGLSALTWAPPLLSSAEAASVENGYVFASLSRETGCTSGDCGPDDPRFDLQRRIVRVNPRTRAARIVCSRCTAPAVSRDGRWLAWAYAPADSAPRGMFVVRASGGSARRVARSGSEPVWSPRATRMAFESGGYVWAVGRDGRGLRRLVRGSDPSWSPDGRRLAFVSRTDPPQVSIIGVSGRGRTVVAAGYEPTWSALGELAFVRDSNPPLMVPVRTVISARSRAGRVRSLTTGDTEDWAPAWSPDGRRLVFTRLVTAGDPLSSIDQRWQLFVVGGSGGRPRALHEAGPHRAAGAWAPDGSLILFYSTAGDDTLWVVRPNGGGARVVYDAGRWTLGTAVWQRKP